MNDTWTQILVYLGQMRPRVVPTAATTPPIGQKSHYAAINSISIVDGNIYLFFYNREIKKIFTVVTDYPKLSNLQIDGSKTHQ